MNRSRPHNRPADDLRNTFDERPPLNSLACRALFALVAIAVSFAPAAAADADLTAADTILLRRGNVTITRAEWDAEVLRIPAKDWTSPRARAASELLERMMTTRELAARAREQKLDQTR
jgi:hypothetical protein